MSEGGASAHEGMLLLDKPPGLTSHDVVDIARARLGIRRIGHTGTLDPMAQGLLVLLVGEATRHQQALQGHEKAYEAQLALGAQTSTGDATGDVLRRAEVSAFERGVVDTVLASFVGPLLQQPPVYSAVKVEGRPSYWWARRGRALSLPSRLVHIRAMTLIECRDERIRFLVECSAGTYVRTLGEAIAERLGTVGHLDELIRLRVGPWTLEDARPVAWMKTAAREELARAIRPIAAFADSPR